MVIKMYCKLSVDGKVIEDIFLYEELNAPKDLLEYDSIGYDVGVGYAKDDTGRFVDMTPSSPPTIPTVSEITDEQIQQILANLE